MISYFVKEAIKNYNGFKDIVWHGDMYRLINPHENDISAVMLIKEKKSSCF
jgi:alpha-galactosidase